MFVPKNYFEKLVKHYSTRELSFQQIGNRMQQNDLKYLAQEYQDIDSGIAKPAPTLADLRRGTVTTAMGNQD